MSEELITRREATEEAFCLESGFVNKLLVELFSNCLDANQITKIASNNPVICAVIQ